MYDSHLIPNSYSWIRQCANVFSLFLSFQFFFFLGLWKLVSAWRTKDDSISYLSVQRSIQKWYIQSTSSFNLTYSEDIYGITNLCLIPALSFSYLWAIITFEKGDWVASFFFIVSFPLPLLANAKDSKEQYSLLICAFLRWNNI